MMKQDRLALICGVGALSEKVREVAKEKYPNHTPYCISGLLDGQSGIWGERERRDRLSTPIHPFRFQDMGDHLLKGGSTSAFFVGDLPLQQLVPSQEYELATRRMNPAILSTLVDQRGLHYLGRTSGRPYARYFQALEALLHDCGVKPRHAIELFPEFNPRVGDNTKIEMPSAYRLILPQAVERLLEVRDERDAYGIRPSQSAIVAGGEIVAVESDGTDQLLKEYRAQRRRRLPGYLLKVPSVEFNAAFDEPTIGPHTMDLVAAAGLKGVAVCSEISRVFDLAATVSTANSQGLFLFATSFTQLRDAYLRRRPNCWAQAFSIAGEPQ